MKRSIWAIILALLVLIPISISAEVKTAEPFGFTETDGLHVSFLLLEDACTDAIIPEEFDGTPVVSIEAGALEGFPRVERIHIPASVMHIDADVFVAHPDTTLIVHRDSYAHLYAIDNELTYGIRGSAAEAEYVADYLGEWESAAYYEMQNGEMKNMGDSYSATSELTVLKDGSFGEEGTSYEWCWTEEGLYCYDGDNVIELTLQSGKLILSDETHRAECVRPAALVAITVTYKPITDNGFTYSEEVYCMQGGKLVIEANPACIPNGYELFGADQYTVEVDKDGIPSKDSVTFYYQSIPCPHSSYWERVIARDYEEIFNDNAYHLTEAVYEQLCLKCNESVSTYTSNEYEPHDFEGDVCTRCGYMMPKPTQIVPYNYKTQYGKGSASYFGKYSNETPYLEDMMDDNINTRFMWVSYTSEYEDATPDFTFYFAGEEITHLKIRNGDLRSETNYYGHGRLKELRLVIYYDGKSATEIVDIPDIYSAEYYEHEMSRKYTNVTKIEVAYRQAGRVQGKKSGEVNFFYITDIMFMGY